MKPSSRIIQLAQEITKKRGIPKDTNEALDLRIECITRYLDEEWQAKQPKTIVKKS